MDPLQCRAEQHLHREACGPVSRPHFHSADALLLYRADQHLDRLQCRAEQHLAREASGLINIWSACNAGLNNIWIACNAGLNNIWIAKPAGKSRGRGIALFHTADALLQYTRGTNDSQWIVQKYIERPLLVRQRKFDIRQWVLVTSWSPIKAWFYGDCYLRFAVGRYSTADVGVHAHLSNNAISKAGVPAFDGALMPTSPTTLTTKGYDHKTPIHLSNNAISEAGMPAFHVVLMPTSPTVPPLDRACRPLEKNAGLNGRENCSRLQILATKGYDHKTPIHTSSEDSFTHIQP